MVNGWYSLLITYYLLLVTRYSLLVTPLRSLMKLKLRIIFFAGALVVTLLSAKLISNPDSLVSWYIGTTKSELWAISHKWKNSTPGLDPNTSSESNLADVVSSSLTTTDIAQNWSNQTLPDNFPLGWYDSVDNLDTPAQIANQGINIVMPYTGKSSIKEVRAYLDRAAAAGIKVMVEIPRDEVRRDHRWLITQFVKNLKTHPAVFGWYLYDEPEFIKLSPRLLERVYRAIKTEDPRHTVAMAFGKLIHVRRYLKALDAVIYFKYPCYYDSPKFCNLQDGIFRKLAESAAFIARDQSHFWMVLQGYGEDKYGRPTKFNRRLPSLEEERYMVYSAILAQVDGLFFWTHYLSQPQWIDAVLTPLVRELKTCLSTISNSRQQHPLKTDNPEIQARLYQNSITQDLLLIAINHGSHQLKTAIAIKENIKVNGAKVLQTNFSIDIDQGILTDTFEPYAVHVYQLK